MIGNTVKKMLLENESDFLIVADNVATLSEDNTLEHALLVLTNIGYSRIPVLNKQGQLMGQISLDQVVSQMFDIESLNPEKLDSMTVGEVMDRQACSIQMPFNIEKILNQLVDFNFVPVVDKQDVFLGIVTRKEILKSVNYLAHELESQYELVELFEQD
ncbi:cyclic-di-AMP-binding protein CbpB [Vagococcus jeotgali]|uniref:cyclic-di-AMP-binding protein CbpB n=1 Tax=Vagococcus jeotgali TaxID=3109030 RepID=UPI002DDA692C|nr:cyclic-di-AMP-binding protein CbpB [Vagococcus sp. B2T-5]